jgi:hypothetical protein
MSRTLIHRKRLGQIPKEISHPDPAFPQTTRKRLNADAKYASSDFGGSHTPFSNPKEGNINLDFSFDFKMG